MSDVDYLKLIIKMLRHCLTSQDAQCRRKYQRQLIAELRALKNQRPELF